MKPQLKAKWIEALESGRYEQTRGALHVKDEGYCCLGVLCDVIDPAGWLDAKNDSIDCKVRFACDNEIRWGFPPISLLNKAGLDPDFAEQLAAMNDGGIPFAGIAEHIRKKA